MEATVVANQNGAAAEGYDGQAEATRSTAELFQWSMFVHVGAGADECEHGEDGACQDASHFHAWVCLPNAFQMRDIGEKARAARARRKRALRDPESDSYAVLEDDLADIARDRMDELIDAVARTNVDKQLTDIVDELRRDERFENHEQDAEEFRRLDAVPEGERDTEEYERLGEQIKAYAERFDEVIQQRQERERTSLRNLKTAEVVDIERRSRIDAIATEFYLHTYYTWSMYIGTRRPTTDGFPSRRKFKEPEDLKNAPPEVVTALREAIRTLEERTTVRSDAAGNS